ncbi:RNA pyrophosphohydrolase [Sphingomonas spermidinifaciens]|uniref:RNA pyrophosphohydrolase n=1 Tax=Sphingomonas spermidinifaciens TaxID=1141889 RepID=A0A2A4B4R5_9SPHN|nr:RNA pyrophosphohydrolase [Sphingomonas spermidinifaciens]PCD02654.1 RNA pyrophosphohydrolase [Sphingomonas spermidinifaciens]
MSEHADLPYRPCAGVMLLNARGEVFVGQRLDSVVEAWQMPQGGIDPGEAPLEAAIRELGEEAGIAPEHVQLVAEAPDELYYDLPEDLIGRIWKGKWRGQRQRWFLFRFLGTDEDVNIRTAEPEFRAWRWVEPSQLPELIVPFKRDLYRQLLDIFGEPLRAHGGPVR